MGKLRATVLRISFMVVIALGVLAAHAQPADPTAPREHPSSAPGGGGEPIAMVLSGAGLLSLAGALRRYLP